MLPWSSALHLARAITSACAKFDLTDGTPDPTAGHLSSLTSPLTILMVCTATRMSPQR